MAANTQGKRSPPARRVQADEPYDPDIAAIEVARRRGLDPEQVLRERRRVLRPRI